MTIKRINQPRGGNTYACQAGIGIQHTIYGDAIWQNAITLAFRGIMVIYPREGHGIVVLTNSEFGLPVAYDIAEKALGGKRSGSFFSKIIKFTYDNLTLMRSHQFSG